jgi:nicotinamidase-related amidase
MNPTLSPLSRLPQARGPKFGAIRWDDQQAQKLLKALEEQRVVGTKVDCQNDFFYPGPVQKLNVKGTVQNKPTGLPITGATAILPTLMDVQQTLEAAGIPRVATKDTHTPNDQEFQIFPPHCIELTPGHDLVTEVIPFVNPYVISVAPNEDDVPTLENLKALFLRGREVHIEKNTYDLFTRRTGNNRFDSNDKAHELYDTLAAAGLDTDLVTGVATDICDASFAESAANKGRNVILITDAAKGVFTDDPESDLPFLNQPGNPTIRQKLEKVVVATWAQVKAVLDEYIARSKCN